jgi:hypothetical protein
MDEGQGTGDEGAANTNKKGRMKSEELTDTSFDFYISKKTKF